MMNILTKSIAGRAEGKPFLPSIYSAACGAVLMLLASTVAQADMTAMDDELLSEEVAQAGLSLTMESPEFKPLGNHPVLDPDDPPNFKLVYSANKLVFYGDSTPDSEQQQDFWVYIDRITTNPNACTVDDGDEATCVASGGDSRMRIEFDFDLASRQVERLIRENGNSATPQTKLHYFIWSFKDTGSVIDFGPGDNSNPFADLANTDRYWDHDATGTSIAGGDVCSFQHLGNASCAFRGLSLHILDSDSTVSCDDCQGNFLDEVNIYGEWTGYGHMLQYGRQLGLAEGS